MKLSKEFGRDRKINFRIYELAGEEFNINSPKQLGHILFDVLKLPVIKEQNRLFYKYRSFRKIKDKHPIIENYGY